MYSGQDSLILSDNVEIFDCKPHRIDSSRYRLFNKTGEIVQGLANFRPKKEQKLSLEDDAPMSYHFNI